MFLYSPYTFTIPENSSGLTFLSRVGQDGISNVVGSSRDPAATFTYAAWNTTLFLINPATGDVQSSSAAVFDYFVRTAYWFTAVVTDSYNLTATTNVTVSVLLVNQPPVFKNATALAIGYTIGRNSQPGTVSPSVISAWDRESDPLAYNIDAQAVPGMFAINPVTGVLTLVAYSTLLEPPTVFWVVVNASGVVGVDGCLRGWLLF